METLIEKINHWSSPSQRMAFWWLGQASVIVKMAGKVIYIDPYLSPRKKRQVPPMLKPEEVTNADFVLCSHDHSDHLDAGAIPGIAAASPQAIFCVPNPLRQRVIDLGVPSERVIGVKADEHQDPPSGVEMGGLKITGVKAKHEFFDPTPEGDFPYLGYVIEANRCCLYHSGDTLCYEGLLTRLKCFQLTLAFLPINGRDAVRFRRGCLGNMTFQEAVDLAGELRPQLTVPIHYDMFADNPGDPQLFADYLTAKYPDLEYWIGPHAETVEVGFAE